MSAYIPLAEMGDGQSNCDAKDHVLTLRVGEENLHVAGAVGSAICFGLLAKHTLAAGALVTSRSFDGGADGHRLLPIVRFLGSKAGRLRTSFLSWVSGDWYFSKQAIRRFFVYRRTTNLIAMIKATVRRVQTIMATDGKRRRYWAVATEAEKTLAIVPPLIPAGYTAVPRD